jgi:hypothetical protein
LGHGVVEGVRDVVFVHNDVLTMNQMKALAEEVGRLNQSLAHEGRPYVLIGPGRWGSSDPSLGIPIDTSQVLGAKVIVELPFGDREVEPSQGSHFFHELTAMRIGYLTMTRDRADLLDRDWLSRQPVVYESDHVRQVRVQEPLQVLLDGKRRRGTVLKPKVEEEVL